jgi:hypothetical protein
MATKAKAGVPRYFFISYYYCYCYCCYYFLWSFCAFLNKGSSKTPKKLFGENPCQNFLAKKVEEKKLFPCRLFPSDLKISKNLKTRYRGTYPLFIFYFKCPLTNNETTNKGPANKQKQTKTKTGDPRGR